MEALQPNWDLDQYILNYSGHGQIHRLRFIALKSSTLQVDALKLAIRLIKDTTFNVSLYQETVEQLRLVDSISEESVLDRSWVENATRSTKITTEKLEAELKNYKNNLIKESIRVTLQLLSVQPLTRLDGSHGSCRTLLQMWRLRKRTQMLYTYPGLLHFAKASTRSMFGRDKCRIPNAKLFSCPSVYLKSSKCPPRAR